MFLDYFLQRLFWLAGYVAVPVVPCLLLTTWGFPGAFTLPDRCIYLCRFI